VKAQIAVIRQELQWPDDVPEWREKADLQAETVARWSIKNHADESLHNVPYGPEHLLKNRAKWEMGACCWTLEA